MKSHKGDKKIYLSLGIDGSKPCLIPIGCIIFML